jgi:hypothetical protein
MNGVSLGVSTGSTTGASLTKGVSLPNRPLPSQAQPGNPVSLVGFDKLNHRGLLRALR